MSIPANLQIDLSNVTKWESRGRTVHSHWDGVEIQRTFYMRPFSEAHQVASALQGSVYPNNPRGARDWVRRLPARDSSHGECYCNEVRIDHVDPQKDSISFSPSLKWSRNIYSPNPESQVLDFLVRTRAVGEQPAGGAFLTASYRPLISAYIPSVSQPGDDPSDLERSKMFDWIDPRFAPGQRSVPWPEGLEVEFLAAGLRVPAQVPPEAAQPIHIPIHEFTIRRLLVGEIPWNTINALTNTVNSGLRPFEGMLVKNMFEGPGWPYREDWERTTLPTFPAGTLRFDKCEVIEHYSRVCENQLWYELIYHFTWLCYQSPKVFNYDGVEVNPSGLAPVTWNHVFMRPSFYKVKGVLGWYSAVKMAPPDWLVLPLPFQRLLYRGVGPLYDPADFDVLFDLQAD